MLGLELPLPHQLEPGLAGEGWGEGANSAPQHFTDAFEDSLQRGQYLVVPESQYSKTMALQYQRTMMIILLTVRVLAAIYLHDQSGLNATEINSVVSYAVLAAELRTIQLTCAEAPPQRVLCICLVSTQVAAAVDVSSRLHCAEVGRKPTLRQ